MGEVEFESLSAALKRNRTLKHLKLNYVCSNYEPIYEGWDIEECGLGLMCRVMGEAVGSSSLESFSFCVLFSIIGLLRPGSIILMLLLSFSRETLWVIHMHPRSSRAPQP